MPNYILRILQIRHLEVFGSLIYVSSPTNRSIIRKSLFHRCYNGSIQHQPSSYLNFILKRKPNLSVQNTIFKCSFHTTNYNNGIPPIIWVVLKSASKLIAVFTGRGIRKWWANLPKNKKDLILQEIVKQKNKIFIGSSLSVGIVFVYYTMHLTEDPITKRRRFILYSDNQMNQTAMIMSEILMRQYENKIVTSGYQYSYVLGIAQRILQANKDLPGTDRTWKLFIVVDKKTKNAVVLPNGHIFIFTGILSTVSNDDQLATIIGHELAHALLRHSAEVASKTELLDMLLLLPIVAIWTLFPASVAITSHFFTNLMISILFKLPFSRSLEIEADTVGLQMISRACFNPKQASVFWRKMEKLGEEDVIEWVSTHPSHNTRYTNLEMLMPEAINTFMKFCRKD